MKKVKIDSVGFANRDRVVVGELLIWVGITLATIRSDYIGAIVAAIGLILYRSNEAWFTAPDINSIQATQELYSQLTETEEHNAK